MKVLRARNIPLALHADLGNDEAPTRYLPLIKKVLRLYPDNKIVWMHMGLSRELVDMNVSQHILIVKSLLDHYPNLIAGYFLASTRRPLLLKPGLHGHSMFRS